MLVVVNWWWWWWWWISLLIGDFSYVSSQLHLFWFHNSGNLDWGGFVHASLYSSQHFFYFNSFPGMFVLQKFKFFSLRPRFGFDENLYFWNFDVRVDPITQLSWVHDSWKVQRVAFWVPSCYDPLRFTGSYFEFSFFMSVITDTYP